MMLRNLIAAIGFLGLALVACPLAAIAEVTLNASATGVQKGGQLTFTATTNQTDPVVKVTFSYEGTNDTDVDTAAPYEVIKTMDWMTKEDLRITATVDYVNIGDEVAEKVADVVDITLYAATQPYRGTTVTFGTQTDPTGLSVSSWYWTYDTSLLDIEMTDTEDSDDDSMWHGRVVLSGTLSVEASILGVECTKEVEISVQDRTGWSTPIDCVEDNEPLWGAPPFGYDEPLGEIRDKDSNVIHIIVPQTSTGDWSDGVILSGLTSGPNEGLWYVLSTSLEIDQETVINRYIKSGGPPPVPWATSFFDYNDAGCISGDMADFVTAVMHHEYRGTPPTVKSLEGHFGRMEVELDTGPGDPADAIEGLIDTTEAALMTEVNWAVGFIEGAIDGFTGDGAWSDAGPNWGGEGSLGSGEHTRYDVIGDQYYPGCTFGPSMF